MKNRRFFIRILFSFSLLAFIAFFFYFGPLFLLKTSKTYQVGLRFIDFKQQEIKKILESDFKVGWWVEGEISKERAGLQKANLKFPLKALVEGKSNLQLNVFLIKKENWEVLFAEVLFFDEVNQTKKTNPLTKLKFLDSSWHSHSSQGPINKKRLYLSKETIFWNVVVSGFKVLNDQVHLTANLEIQDLKTEKSIKKFPKIIDFNGSVFDSKLSFELQFDWEGSGQYQALLLVTDNLVGDHYSYRENFFVEAAKRLEISRLRFGESKHQNKFLANQTIDVFFEVLHPSVRKGQIWLGQDLYVFDQQKNLVINKPALIEVKEPWLGQKDQPFFHNQVQLNQAGTYTVKITVRDLWSGYFVTTQKKIVIFKN